MLAAAALALMLSPDPADPVDILWLLPTLPVWLVLFRLYGLYERDVKRVNASALDDLPSLFHAFVVGTLILWAYLRVFEGHGALTLVETIVFGASGVLIAMTLRVVARRAVIRFGGPSRVLLVGQSPVTEALVRKMQCPPRVRPRAGRRDLGQRSHRGQVRAPVSRPASTSVDLGYLAAQPRRRAGDRHRPGPARRGDDGPGPDLRRRRGEGEHRAPTTSTRSGPSVAIDDIEGLTVLGLNPLVLSRSSRMLKRALDIAGATAGIVLGAPLLLACAIAIKLDSRGPVLFRQRRIGRGGEPFTLLKFRTMVVDAEAPDGGASLAQRRPRLAEARPRPARDPGRARSCARPASMSCRSSGTC